MRTCPHFAEAATSCVFVDRCAQYQFQFNRILFLEFIYRTKIHLSGNQFAAVCRYLFNFFFFLTTTTTYSPHFTFVTEQMATRATCRAHLKRKNNNNKSRTRKIQSKRASKSVYVFGKSQLNGIMVHKAANQLYFIVCATIYMFDVCCVLALMARISKAVFH